MMNRGVMLFVLCVFGVNVLSAGCSPAHEARGPGPADTGSRSPGQGEQRAGASADEKSAAHVDGGVAGDVDGVPPFVPKTGQHGILVRCAGPPRTAENPFGVSRQLLSDPAAFFRHQERRALQLHAITGNARLVFHMINGWDHGRMPYSAAVLGAMPERRRIAFEAMVQRLNEAGVAVGVYFSSKVPQVADSIRVAETEPIESFVWENPRHRAIMLEGIIQPLLDIGVREIWLDNASPSATRQEYVRLAEEVRRRGGYLVMEATPRLASPAGALDRKTVTRIASASLDRFIYSNNDLRNNQWLPLPADTEIIAIISAHQTRGNQVPDNRASRLAYLSDQTALRLSQGFTVFNMEEENDAAFFARVHEWKQHRAVAGEKVPR